MAYSPTPAPQKLEDIIGYLYKELLQISGELHKVEEGQAFTVRSVEPQKPREGMLAIAAGSPHWNPGSGKGLYEYRDGNWHKL